MQDSATSDTAFQHWNPSVSLKEASPLEIRYSKGYLRSHPETWFVGLEEHWSPLMAKLGLELSDLKVEQSLSFLERLYWVASIDINGQPAVMGCDESSYEVLSQCVVESETPGGAEVVVEYLARRFLANLQATSVFEEPLKFSIFPERICDIADVVSSVAISFNIAGRRAQVVFGLGSKVLDQIDASVRERELLRVYDSNVIQAEDVFTLSIEMAELAVQPAKLIDYLKPGAIVDLERPFSESVLLRSNELPFASAKLLKTRGSYVIQVGEADPSVEQFPSGTTRMRVELEDLEVDSSTMIELQKVGSMHVLDTQLSSPVSLVVSGERVARAELGTVQGNLAIKILPRV